MLIFLTKTKKTLNNGQMIIVRTCLNAVYSDDEISSDYINVCYILRTENVQKVLVLLMNTEFYTF